MGIEFQILHSVVHIHVIKNFNEKCTCQRIEKKVDISWNIGNNNGSSFIKLFSMNFNTSKQVKLLY